MQSPLKIIFALCATFTLACGTAVSDDGLSRQTRGGQSGTDLSAERHDEAGDEYSDNDGNGSIDDDILVDCPAVKTTLPVPLDGKRIGGPGAGRIDLPGTPREALAPYLGVFSARWEPKHPGTSQAGTSFFSVEVGNGLPYVSYDTRAAEIRTNASQGSRCVLEGFRYWIPVRIRVCLGDRLQNEVLDTLLTTFVDRKNPIDSLHRGAHLQGHTWLASLRGSAAPDFADPNFQVSTEAEDFSCSEDCPDLRVRLTYWLNLHGRGGYDEAPPEVSRGSRSSLFTWMGYKPMLRSDTQTIYPALRTQLFGLLQDIVKEPEGTPLPCDGTNICNELLSESALQTEATKEEDQVQYQQ